MIAFSLHSPSRYWKTVSFASTLYLQPILDLLLAGVPEECEAVLRLGLQEALVNAAKHGNQLDPDKMILVHFASNHNRHWWVIRDQGKGFVPPTHCELPTVAHTLPHECCECGRGLYILYQVFDQVHWNGNGTNLRLCKDFNRSVKPIKPVIPELVLH